MWITEELAAAVKKKLVVVAAFHASNFNARDSLESVPDAVRRLDFILWMCPLMRPRVATRVGDTDGETAAHILLERLLCRRLKARGTRRAWPLV